MKKITYKANRNTLKYIVTIAFPLYFVICHSTYAAPCYGTHMPNVGKWNAGIQTYIINNRKLKKDYGKVSSKQYFYQMSWMIFDWFCLDGKIGIGDITYRPGAGSKTTYPTNFGGGYGFRSRIYRNYKQKIDAVWGFQHVSVHPGTKVIDGATNYVILDDWQGSVLISKDFGLFVPYVGTRLSRLDLIHRIKGGSRIRKKSDVDFGAVAGADFNLTSSSYLNVEARFIEETSFNVGITYNF